jgi:hypothetical protein
LLSLSVSLSLSLTSAIVAVDVVWSFLLCVWWCWWFIYTRQTEQPQPKIIILFKVINSNK